jgi:hypothetical protein
LHRQQNKNHHLNPIAWHTHISVKDVGQNQSRTKQITVAPSLGTHISVQDVGQNQMPLPSAPSLGTASKTKLITVAPSLGTHISVQDV